ncbi:MAG: PIN domain-containing protein [Nitrospira sp.]|jgi:predicted nucleic acid-binding protein|nr:PIN domain-containing protein [Nitrospira sp.]MDH4243518.1 PIN domain-containing protein [Nitrospira sp.]MDH4354707.1 PIN domain-containing protein [Nitrospira sp.]MDH5316812.1 PIN domain-containing protein [Nitrospira sp.]
MGSFLPDTSVMVATVCTWHEHHERAITEMERRLTERESLVIATPALIETYAVLTRLPPPHRLSPRDALALIETNFLTEGTLEGLDNKAFRPLLREAADHDIAGGRTYDWVIAACARTARVKTLLTFNTRDFLSFRLDGIEIRIP